MSPPRHPRRYRVARASPAKSNPFPLIPFLGLVLSFLTLVLGGGSFYNVVYKQPKLTYTILPSYDLEDQAFGGLVIENRGRVPLTKVELVVSDLEGEIQLLRMPGPHEATVAEGGEGHNGLSMKIERLSSGESVAVYLMTSGKVNLENGKSFRVSAAETTGVLGTAGLESGFTELISGIGGGLITLVVITAWLSLRKPPRVITVSSTRTTNRRRG